MNTIIQNQKGSALVTALLILLSLTVIGIVAVNSSNIETLITTNTKVSKQAFFLAEAGGQEAKETLRQRIIDQGSTLDAQINLVKGPDGILETADDLPFISNTFGAGSYSVKLTEHSGEFVTLTSTGSGPLNSRAIVKLTVRVIPATNSENVLDPAFGEGILTNGNLTINGTSIINGGAHANGNIKLNGDGTVTGTVSAQGSITTGSWDTGAQAPNAATIPVPQVTTQKLDELRAIANTAGKGIYHNGDFNFNGSGDLGNQVIFVDGNLTLNGSIINGTIVATGNVTINGSSQINGNGVIGTAIVAQGNITMNGTSDSYGAFWSNGSFVQNGSGRLLGSIVSLGAFTQNGGFNFTANGNIQNNNLPTIPGTNGPATVAVLGWKQG